MVAVSKMVDGVDKATNINQYFGGMTYHKEEVMFNLHRSLNLARLLQLLLTLHEGYA